MPPIPANHSVAPVRRPGLHRAAALGATGLAGFLVVTAVAVAVPAFAANDESSTSTTLDTIVSQAAELAAAAPTTTAPTTEPAPAPSAEDAALATLAAASPDQVAGLEYLSLSDEQRAALAGALTPAPVAPPAATVSSSADAPGGYLACVRQRESHGNYQVHSSNGKWHGAYQFTQSTWNSTANHTGRGDLVGVNPASASPADQDAMAVELYSWQGRGPWSGDGC